MTLFKICGLRDPDSAVVAAKSGASFLDSCSLKVCEDSYCRNRARRSYPSTERPLEMVAPWWSACSPISRPTSSTPLPICAVSTSPSFAEMSHRSSGASCRYPSSGRSKFATTFPKSDTVALAVQDVELALDAGHLAQLDKHVDGALGGTGFSFDWEVAREIARDHKVLLAGGLTPENVSHAIRVARPWGVDVSSGVETDGEKDADRIRSFAKAVETA